MKKILKSMTILLLLNLNTAFADTNVQRIFCKEPNNFKTEWWVAIGANNTGNLYIDVDKVVGCRPYVGCNSRPQTVYEEAGKVYTSSSTLIYKSRKNILQVDITKRDSYGRFHGLISYHLEDGQVTWNSTIRKLLCTMY